MDRVAARVAGRLRNWGGWYGAAMPGPFGGGRPPVTFDPPRVPLLIEVYIALGAVLTADPSTWAWERITDYVRFNPPASVTTGRMDESGRVGPGRATLTLDNRDGRFSRSNPNGPYYGQLSRNTPIMVTINAGSGAYTVVEQFVNEWPTRWDLSGRDSTVPIHCGGILRRLGQGQLTKSALRRTVLGSSPVPEEYWPMEDGSLAATVHSAITGRRDLVFSGTGIEPGALAGPRGCGTLVRFDSAASASAPVSVANTGFWTVGFALQGELAPSPAAATMWRPVYMELSGGTGLGQLCSTLALAEWTATGFGDETDLESTSPVALGGILGTGVVNVWDGRPHFAQYRFTQNGANIDGELYFDGELIDSGTTAGATLGTPVSIRVGQAVDGTIGGNPTNNLGAHMSIGHVIISSDPDFPNLAEAAHGYVGEQAHTRMTRVADEEGIRFTTAASVSAEMGPQSIATFLDVIRDAEAADQGVLYEKDFGLAYQSLHERLNASVGLPLDVDAGHLGAEPEPADDDQRLRNLWEVTRTGASPQTFSDEDSIATEGTYSDAATVNVNTDAQALDAASWLVHLGTVTEDRWPSLALNLASPDGRDLIDLWAGIGYGARVRAINPPAQVAPDPIDVVIEGKTEQFNPLAWMADMNTSPAAPYRVGVLAETSGDMNPDLGWLESDSCVLATAVDSDDTSWSITSDPLWTTVTDDFPVLIRVGGELVQVTACTGASAPQTWTVVRSINGVVKSHAAGAAITLDQPIILVT